MKVCIFSKPFWPSVGGVEQTTRIMAGLLSDRHHQVTVVTATARQQFDELNEGYKVVRSTGILSMVYCFYSADVVVIKGGISVPAVLAAYLTRRPFVIWHEMAGGLGRGVGLAGWIRKWIEVWLCRHAAVHVAVSNACLMSKKLASNTSTQVIYNPVCKIIAQKAPVCDHAVPPSVDVLFVGRLIEGKGVLVLTAALRNLSRRMSKISVTIIGAGPCRDSMQAELLTVPGVNAVFTGVLDTTHVMAWYANSRCLVLPSTFHPEGMPVVIGEAQTFGLPVIASSQAANIEVVHDAGITCPPGDVEKLADALYLVLTDTALREQFCANARRLAQRYAPSHFLDQIEPLLRSVLPNRGWDSIQ